MDQAFTKSPAQVLAELKTDRENGLSQSEASSRLLKYGRNELEQDEQKSLFALVLEQFQDQLVIILLAAAVISFVLAALETDGDSTAFVEPVVILLILICNAVVGVVQETNAEKAIEALKEYSPDEATVLRNGQLGKIDARLVVPGDIVVLAVGDKVPADCRIVKVSSSSFKVDQSILTGEPFSISKEADLVVSDPDAVRQDQINMVFSGTAVTVGKAITVAVQTGSKTALGEIHDSISSQLEEKTPLKQALDDFGDQLARIISVICILVWLINIRHFNDAAFDGNWIKGGVYYFKIAVALAVAAIPEGLAVIITTCLALGTQKMAAQGAIVRKLRSVETLGCTSVICSDKTGTLTTNQMNVRRLLAFDKPGQLGEWQIEGNTYAPTGRILSKDGSLADRSLLCKNSVLVELSHICSLCNDSKVVYNAEQDIFSKVGEPTEAALKVLVEKLGTEDAAFNAKIPFISEEDLGALTKSQKAERVNAVDSRISQLYTVQQTLEFSRDRKSMSVIAERRPTGYFTRKSQPGVKTHFVKGAPETILERCSFIRTSANYDKPTPLTPQIRDQILQKVTEWGENESLRILAMATVDKPTLPEKLDASQYAKYESNMTFVGLVGMLDPPRKEVKDAIAKCREAGVRVIVITGDNKKTAEAICRSIGVFGPDEDLTGKSYTGREFDALDEKAQQEAVMHASLFSRTEPIHKSQLVDLLKQKGLIVAMTGDGVNDAPALKKADIGVAMGTGTDVAKLASDMVLADDNFSTIVSAVEEGRSIYSNTKQFIRYLISSNIGEVVSIFLTVILGMPEALIPVQLLWVNLVTDGLPATALGFNPADNDIMHQPPRDAKEPIVTPWLFLRYLVVGTYVGAATVFGYAWWFMFYPGGPQISFYQLTNFHSCSSKFPEIGCEMFQNAMAHKATTMSLSILVVVEMFNAMNSLSENQSLLAFPIWNNLYLVFAITLSMILHFIILYVPFFTSLFSITPLNYDEWIAVLWISAPVLLVDEILKLISRALPKKKFKQD